MSFFTVNTKIHIPAVFSDDPAVTLRNLPQTDKEKAEGMTPVRESSRPTRLVRVDQVESVGPTAITMVVRLISSPEQKACSGGVAHLDLQALCHAHYMASAYGLVSVTGPNLDARKPEEVGAWLDTVPLARREAIGEPIFQESAGLKDPFVFAG